MINWMELEGWWNLCLKSKLDDGTLFIKSKETSRFSGAYISKSKILILVIMSL